jgi:hypothetical protein
MTSLLFRVRKFPTDADAMAATEFAIVVPFMFLLHVGGVKLGDGMAINVKISACTLCHRHGYVKHVQEMSEASLGETKAVPRSNVEIPNG